MQSNTHTHTAAAASSCARCSYATLHMPAGIFGATSMSELELSDHRCSSKR